MQQHKKYCYILMLLTALLISGCVTLEQIKKSRTEQEQYLTKGMQLLQDGNVNQARNQLERVVAAAPQANVTEEALFRLALLNINNEAAKGPSRTLELLERLKKEYPYSSWTHLSAPLLVYIPATRISYEKEREQNIILQRENRELRQSNERLKNLDIEMDKKNKENRELNQSIERLKNLDMEMDKKIKR